MKRLGAERDSLTVVNDQVGVPTFAGDLAEVCLLAIEKYSDLSKGIYHFQNQSPCTWFDFATEIMKHHQLECVVQPVSSDQFPTKAKRPSYSVLDCSKIAKELDLHIRSWKETLNAL